MNDQNILDYNESPFSKIIAKEDYIKKVVRIAFKKCNTKLDTPISEKIKIELRTWHKFIKGQYIKSLTYDRLGRYCNLSKDDIRNGIKHIDEIYNPRLPFDFDTKDGVRLDVGVINEGRIRSRIVEYTNKDRENLNIMKSCAKKVMGSNFNPPERLDVRDQTICLSFPPIFAKHFIKLGIEGSKKYVNIKIPPYILKNIEHQRTWWQGNISEEASIYPFIRQHKAGFYIYPRIQLNRVEAVNIPSTNLQSEVTYYHHNIPLNYLSRLKSNIPQITLDEVYMLSNFGIRVKPYFAKLYVNKKYQLTATYTILIYKLGYLEAYLDDIGFELKRHKNQFEMLLNNRDRQTKEDIRDIIIKFYKEVPSYLRGIKRIKFNKWLTKEDKEELLE